MLTYIIDYENTERRMRDYDKAGREEIDNGPVPAVGFKWAVIKIAPSLIPPIPAACPSPQPSLRPFFDLTPH